MNIQRKKFRYSLMKDDTTYYYVAGGAVLTSNVQIPLSKDPVEWKETDLQWKRSDKYHGVFRSFVVPLTFIKDGAAILRHVYYTEGVEGRCILKIERLNHTTQQYELYYIGDIDFSRTQDTKNTFQTAVLDRGLAALLKAKESTAYELPILNSNSLSVLMDGVKLRGSTRWVVAEQGVSAPVTLSNTPLLANMGNGEGLNEPTITDITYQPAPATIDLSHGGIYEAKFAETVTLTASFTIWAFWPSAASNTRTFAIGVRTGHVGGSVVSNGFMYVAPYALSPGMSGTFAITPANSSFTVNLNAGDSVGIFFLMIDNPTAGNFSSHVDARYKVYGSDGWMEIYTEYRRPATTVRWRRQISVLQDLVSKMSDGQYGVVSGYLTNPTARFGDANAWNTLLTSGDALRGLGDGAANPAKMKITLDDIVQDAIGRDMCGIGVEGNNMRYERLDYFYRNDITIVDLGEVNNLQVSAATDYVWNTLKIGYKYQEQDKLNGKDDPFLTHQYASIGIRVKSERDAVSPFVASIVTHEYLRANLGGKKTTDSSSDNDICIAEISGATNGPFGTYTLARAQNSAGGTVQNILAGSTAYNLALTPKRNLLRNGPFIRTALHLLDNTLLTFQTADQNAELVSKLGSFAQVIEKADVPVNSLGSPLFLPIIFTFETQVPMDIAALIDAQPYGKIAFTWQGKSFSGFILEAGIKPADNAIYTYKLLAAPDTNLSNLIR